VVGGSGDEQLASDVEELTEAGIDVDGLLVL
jgi:hypothetical protein